MGVIHYVAIGLGLLFVYAGTIKVVPINPGGQGYDHMRKEFERFATVSPLKALGIDLSPDMYCSIVGVFEVMVGSLLAFGRYRFRVLSAIDVVFLMNGAMYTLYALGESPANFIPAFVCEILGILIFIFRDGLRNDSTATPSGNQSKKTKRN